MPMCYCEHLHMHYTRAVFKVWQCWTLVKLTGNFFLFLCGACVLKSSAALLNVWMQSDICTEIWIFSKHDSSSWFLLTELRLVGCEDSSREPRVSGRWSSTLSYPRTSIFQLSSRYCPHFCRYSFLCINCEKLSLCTPMFSVLGLGQAHLVHYVVSEWVSEWDIKPCLLIHLLKVKGLGVCIPPLTGEWEQ